MKDVGYVRVSTEDQGLDGLGMGAQTHALSQGSARRRRELASIEADEVSGAAPLDKRPGLLAAIARLEKGDNLVVMKRDRLGRDPIVVAMIESAVNRKGCRVVSEAGEGTENDDPSSILMRRLIDAFAEYERLIIKARTSAALKVLQRSNARTGSVPYGKRLVDDGRRSKGNLPNGLAPDTEEEAALELIRLNAGKPLRWIAAELDRAGFRTKHGRPWQHSTVRKLLSRTAQVMGGQGQ